MVLGTQRLEKSPSSILDGIKTKIARFARSSVLVCILKILHASMGTYFVREIMPIRLPHNFFNIDPFWVIFVSFEG